MFLIRTAFWLSVVILLLPTGTPTQSNDRTRVGAGEAVSAASAVVSDMRQFCTRQPEACVVGSQAMVEFGQKAQAGAKMLYEFLNEKFGAEATGSVANKSAKATASTPSQNTLTPGDRSPAWRGPNDPKRPA